MPKNTTQCPRPGLEPGPLAPESSTLTMRPPRLPQTRKVAIDNFFSSKNSSSLKLVNPYVVTAVVAIVLWLGGHCFCCLFYCTLKGFQAIHVRPATCPFVTLVLILTMLSKSSFCIYSLMLTFMILLTNAGRLEPSKVFCLLAISYNMQPRAQMSLL